MTDEELQAIRQRAERTPPHYGLYQDGMAITGMRLNTCGSVGLGEEPLTKPVLDLFAHARADVLALLAEVERLRDEVAMLSDALRDSTATRSRVVKDRDALLAVVRAVAEPGGMSDNGYSDTNYCRCDPPALDDDEPDENGAWWVHHRPNCPIAQARALVAAHDAATGASATGQQVVLRGSISDECKRGEHAKCKGWTDKGACVCGCGHTKPL